MPLTGSDVIIATVTRTISMTCMSTSRREMRFWMQKDEFMVGVKKGGILGSGSSKSSKVDQLLYTRNVEEI